MSTINKIADGVIWTVACKFLSAAYAFVAVPILIGLYGKADYGLIGLALSINIYMTLLDDSTATFLIGETLVVVVEALCYEALVRKPSQAMAYSVLCNAVSCLFGILVQLLGIMAGIL